MQNSTKEFHVTPPFREPLLPTTNALAVTTVDSYFV
jgi:hypothetical protein